MSLRASLVARAALLAAAPGLFVLALAAGSTGAPPAGAQAPRIIDQFPEDGDVLEEPPFVLYMCFARPVNVQDLDKGGDFRFRLERPDSLGVGMRIVFQPDGYGVAIYPGYGLATPAAGGTPAPTIEPGEWVWEYRLTDAETLEPLEGAVRFTVDPEAGEETLKATPPACQAPGATPPPTLIRVGTQTPAPVGNSPGAGGGGEEEGGSEPDVERLVLLTVGAAAVAAVVGLLAYAFRKAVGYDPHKPGDGPPPEHH